ncbi:MAG: type II toxin-antitoxin system RelE/ParE family toxin [Chloroflexi bacterium]|nr:type II toxin-antitoxin system RelE/ParE family toxin [Chloroflexota bacterium]
MDVRFADNALARLETELSFRGRWPRAVVRAFRKRMQAIRAASDERVFYRLKSFHYEKLAGARSHQHSMRLNNQFRLIVEYEGKPPNKIVVVIAIEDYH